MKISAGKPILQQMELSDIGLHGYQIQKISRRGDSKIKASFDTKLSGRPKCDSERFMSKGSYSPSRAAFGCF